MCNFITASALADTKVSRAILNFQVIYRSGCFHRPIFRTSKNGKYDIIPRKLCLIMFIDDIQAVFHADKSIGIFSEMSEMPLEIFGISGDFQNKEESRCTIRTVGHSAVYFIPRSGGH